jgi:hypothetical protein
MKRYAAEKTISNKICELREQLKAMYPGLNCTVRKEYSRIREETDISRAYCVCVYGQAKQAYQRDDGDVGHFPFVTEHFYVALDGLKSLSMEIIKSKMDLPTMAAKNETAPIEHEKALQKREQEYRKREAAKLAKLKAERENSGFVPQVHTIQHPSNPNSGAFGRTRVFVQGATGHGEVTGFFVGHIPPGKFGTRETGGGIVEGPWAYAFADSICISADGRGTHWEVEQAKAKGLVVEARVGDLLEVDGTQYSIEWDDTFGRPRTAYIKLIPTS